MSGTWKSPTNILAAIGLATSIVVNIYQYISAEEKLSLEREKWEAEFNLERQKWENDLKDKESLKRDRAKLELELEDVKEAIRIWDNSLFRYNLELGVMKNRLQSLTNPFEIDTQKKNILVHEDAIRQSENEREIVVNRRKEIERLLAIK